MAPAAATSALALANRLAASAMAARIDGERKLYEVQLAARRERAAAAAEIRAMAAHIVHLKQFMTEVMNLAVGNEAVSDMHARYEASVLAFKMGGDCEDE